MNTPISPLGFHNRNAVVLVILGRPIPHNIYSAVKDHLIGTKEYDSVDNAIDTAEGDPLRQLQAKRAAMRMQAFKEEAAYSLGHDLDDIQQTLGE